MACAKDESAQVRVCPARKTGSSDSLREEKVWESLCGEKAECETERKSHARLQQLPESCSLHSGPPCGLLEAGLIAQEGEDCAPHGAGGCPPGIEDPSQGGSCQPSLDVAGGTAAAGVPPAPAMAAEVRLKKLEELVLDRSAVGLETLVDLLLCVHHELSTSPLAQEKYIMEFLQWGESARSLLESFLSRLANSHWPGSQTGKPFQSKRKKEGDILFSVVVPQPTSLELVKMGLWLFWGT